MARMVGRRSLSGEPGGNLESEGEGLDRALDLGLRLFGLGFCGDMHLLLQLSGPTFCISTVNFLCIFFFVSGLVNFLGEEVSELP